MNKDELWDHNVKIFDRMNVAAGSVIKQLLVDLKSIGVFIELGQASSHKVTYTMHEGENLKVALVAKELGITGLGGELVVPGG